MSTEIILIDNMQVRRDHHGRLRLNDIHQQAGGEARHKVDNYLRSDRAQALTVEFNVSDVRSIAPVNVSKGRTGGTYAVEEIALDYAAWIDSGLALRIQRAFAALRRGDVQGAAEQAYPGAKVQVEYKTPQNYIEALRALADAEEAKEQARLEAENCTSVQQSEQVLGMPSPILIRRSNYKKQKKRPAKCGRS